ncbi:MULTISPECIES: low temperature requirement protein A [Kocuria]|uniref:low temperature requirement protein A n=1 Tax=Kocuria TaxID=57493 RepID=UPI0021B4E1E3|nr:MULTISPECIES: low temperature requirement protein A [Kocuria]
MNTFAGSMFYGYTHFFIFAAAGAFSAGIEVEIDVLTGDSELHAPWSSFASSIPLAVFLLGVWAVAIRCNAERTVRTVLPLARLLVPIDPLLPVPFGLIAVVLMLTVAVLVWRQPVDRPMHRPVNA